MTRRTSIGRAAASMPKTRTLPVAGLEQRGDHPDRGGLARAVRPEQAVHLAGRDRQVHVVHGQVRGELVAQVHAVDGLGHGPAGVTEAALTLTAPPSARRAGPVRGSRRRGPAGRRAAAVRGPGPPGRCGCPATARSGRRPPSVTVSRTERPSLAPRSRLSSPSSASLLTIVLTLLGASRSSAAASATPMPGRRAASRSSSDRAGGSGSGLRRRPAPRGGPPGAPRRSPRAAGRPRSWPFRWRRAYIVHRANYMSDPGASQPRGGLPRLSERCPFSSILVRCGCLSH